MLDGHLASERDNGGLAREDEDEWGAHAADARDSDNDSFGPPVARPVASTPKSALAVERLMSDDEYDAMMGQGEEEEEEEARRLLQVGSSKIKSM